MLSMTQIKKYRTQLHELSLKPLPEGNSRREAERRLIAQWRGFVPDKSIGRQLYQSFTDEELIAILKEAFDRLGHAPVQDDIFCFYRTYIKHRFVTWPAALKAAGLSHVLDNRIGLVTAEEFEKIENAEPEIRALLIRLTERWAELGYPPKRKEFPESESLKQRFGSWGNALHAAEEFEQWQLAYNEKAARPFSPEDELCLRELKDKARVLGRTPLKTEIHVETRCRLRICCGSWDTVLQRAGLSPMEGDALAQAQWDEKQRQRAGEESLYRIPDLEPEYWEILEEILTLTKKLNRAPMKEEIDPGQRKWLQERCSSWRNALYQVGVAALTKQETAKVKTEKRDLRKRQKETELY
ncbi:MAG TPA: hypothetical protein VN381_16620 [Anaerovoracaceae bacterium]|nr:hypothetical protein [Anaerovoracaceae bacterium]